jgi:hypothetical protein
MPDLLAAIETHNKSGVMPGIWLTIEDLEYLLNQINEVFMAPLCCLFPPCVSFKFANITSLKHVTSDNVYERGKQGKN